MPILLCNRILAFSGSGKLQKLSEQCKKLKTIIEEKEGIMEDDLNLLVSGV